MSRHGAEQLKHRDIIVRRIKRVIHVVSSSKCNHDKFLSYRNTDVFNHGSWKKLTGYSRSYCNGFFDALTEEMVKEHIRWYHFWTDDKGVTHYVRQWEQIPEELREPANNGERKFESSHFWKDTSNPW